MTNEKPCDDQAKCILGRVLYLLFEVLHEQGRQQLDVIIIDGVDGCISEGCLDRVLGVQPCLRWT